MMSKLALSLVLVVLAVMIGFAAYVRLAPSDPAVWHVDPLTVQPPDTPNFDLVGSENGGRSEDIFNMPPDELLAKFNAIALATPGVSAVAGSVPGDFITYVARSRFWGFPDYISVKAIPVEGGAQLVAFSRARFGRSDMGVNKARMDRWLRELHQESG